MPQQSPVKRSASESHKDQNPSPTKKSRSHQLPPASPQQSPSSTLSTSKSPEYLTSNSSLSSPPAAQPPGSPDMVVVVSSPPAEPEREVTADDIWNMSGEELKAFRDARGWHSLGEGLPVLPLPGQPDLDYEMASVGVAQSNTHSEDGDNDDNEDEGGDEDKVEEKRAVGNEW